MIMQFKEETLTRGTLWRFLSMLVLALMLLQPVLLGPGQLLGAQRARADADDPRYFSETGFRISDDRFWDYFQKRGGLRSFGFPVSRKFMLLGSEVQIFQRRIMQIQPNGSVGLLNLLDSDLLPYTSINGANLPAKNDALVAQAPPVGSANYASDISQFIQTRSPDNWNNLQTNFYQTYNDSVKLEEAYPDGDGSPNWLPGLNMELWGVPVSEPALDPKNYNFAYLRFQRGILHFDNNNGLTQGLLLADIFKSILTGINLPFDVAGPAVNSRYFKQYDNSKPDGLLRPADLPNSNLKNAFEKDAPLSGGGDTPTPLPAGTTPTATPASQPATSGMAYGMQVHILGQDQNRILGLVKGAGFGWIKQQVRWSEMEDSKGNINFGKLDPMVDRAAAQGVKVLFSVVTVPSWTRGDRRNVGPPDNMNDFGDFMAALASRYKGRVHAYEVWNEQNMKVEWTPPLNPCGYVNMLKVAAPRIKAADPNAIVISGALTPTGVNDPNGAIDDAVYLDQMYQCEGGILKTLGDAIGAHATGYNNAPDDWVDKHSVSTPGFKDHGSFYFKRIWQLHDIMVKNGDNRKMWLTEYHWGAATAPVPGGYEWTTHLGEATVADFFVRSIEMMKAENWVGGFFIWNLNFRTMGDYHKSETAIFGILNEDWSPRAIYTRLRDMPK